MRGPSFYLVPAAAPGPTANVDVTVVAGSGRGATQCERADPKGLCERARAGVLTGPTGVDGADEPPLAPELELHPGRRTVQESVARALDLLTVPTMRRSAQRAAARPPRS